MKGFAEYQRDGADGRLTRDLGKKFLHRTSTYVKTFRAQSRCPFNISKFPEDFAEEVARSGVSAASSSSASVHVQPCLFRSYYLLVIFSASVAGKFGFANFPNDKRLS